MNPLSYPTIAPNGAHLTKADHPALTVIMTDIVNGALAADRIEPAMEFVAEAQALTAQKEKLK